ncbi:hypothetical protein BDQ12DRAFT_607655 [Crucibulum laeve]|uniref:DUF6593 domain-containing protein n=1 Tax=Crucibulum laeve TaxID=68775 RepID=A0A5C3LYN0_9AGAR|nr:hypothetical protein BDQ12DRAFT_607655 [Crucibulum laeve]
MLPREPITYTFTEWASDSRSTLLVPPPDAQDQRPLYRITVDLDLNPFLPLSYVTKIYRAGGESEDLIGEFILSTSHKRAVLTIGDKVTRLSNVLSNINSSARDFSWLFDGTQLRWDCRSNLDDGSPMCICYSPSSDNQVASFVPPPPDACPPLPSAVLTVFPQGHQYLDDIVISALIIERKLTVAY